MKNSFIKCIMLVQTVKDTVIDWPQLDATEEQLLNQIAMVVYSGEQLTSFAAASLLTNLSLGTSYTKLTSLIKKGVIKAERDLHDSRIKRITLTQRSIEYFDKLATCYVESN